MKWDDLLGLRLPESLDYDFVREAHNDEVIPDSIMFHHNIEL